MHPKLVGAGKIAGPRYLIAHENYGLMYEIDEDKVWLLPLMHYARQWPSIEA